MSVFVPIPGCFDYFRFVVWSEVWGGYTSSFIVLSQDALAILGLLYFHINFRIICPSSVKNVMGILIGITLNL